MYIPSEKNVLSVVKNIEELDNLPLSGYKALVNKSNGETFILEGKSGRAVPLVCASSGLQPIVPSTLVTSYLAAQSEQNVLERIQSLNEKVYEQLRQSLSNEGAKSELERFMTSGISKSRFK